MLILGLAIIEIILNKDILASDTLKYSYYYHLDYFMQLLPAGRLVILSKKILSDDSAKKLEELFTDN